MAAGDEADGGAFPFAFTVCQVGAEPAVKDEVAKQRPTWRLAFSRPGLVTFKCTPPVTLAALPPLVFARVQGASLGQAKDAAQVAQLAHGVAQRLSRRLRLAVFERDVAKPGDEPPGHAYGPVADAVADTIWPLLADEVRLPRTLPEVGDLVLDVVVAPEEPWVVGVHVHSEHALPHPGGRVPLALPEAAPSRAWLKLEEGLRWSRLPVKPGDVAVEIGSAPGGASFALLQRGLRVIGVDPGDMDARVLGHPKFVHLATKLSDVRREQLPARVDWLLLDVNLAPQVALHQVRRLVSTLRSTLRGALFTLKLNDWAMAAQAPALVERVRGMGFSDVQATQLATNRQEMCVAARMPARRPR